MDFSLFIFVLLVITGAIWLVDQFILRSRRTSGTGEPWWIEYPKSFFPVILLVFLLRSFLVEPFKIPSGSMLPTLLVGDFILVNKFTYGIRLPILNIKVADIKQPQRGEVMVFRYPDDPSVNFIKRVVGIPGDRITYQGKRLTINGKEIAVTNDGQYDYPDRREGGNFVLTQRFQETLDSHRHAILNREESPPISLSEVEQFPFRDNCVYTETGFTCTVPLGYYFMMGDNRDDSRDSRYWGFVPDKNIVGKAFMIWWNFSDLKRIGHAIN